MLNKLNEASKIETSINVDQANRLSGIAEKIRESLFVDGKNISVYFLETDFEFSHSLDPERSFVGNGVGVLEREKAAWVS